MNSSFFCSPPTYRATMRALREFAAQNRSIHLFRAGRSALGREIPAIGIGNLKNAVLFVGATHAQEWLTASLLLRFAEEFAAAYAAKTELAEIRLSPMMRGKGLLLVPLLNPDGVEIALNGAQTAGALQKQVEQIQAEHPDKLWQANANGVDLNHNFDAGWGVLRAMEIEANITGPAPAQYGGPHPHSEPETRALLQLISAIEPKRLYSFHSQGEEIYWDYEGIPVPQSELLVQTLSALSGYKPVENSGLASHGGLKDWYIETFRRPGFTIEIGKGENPLPIEDLEPLYARLLPMLTAAAFL